MKLLAALGLLALVVWAARRRPEPDWNADFISAPLGWDTPSMDRMRRAGL